MKIWLIVIEKQNKEVETRYRKIRKQCWSCAFDVVFVQRAGKKIASETCFRYDGTVSKEYYDSWASRVQDDVTKQNVKNISHMEKSHLNQKAIRPMRREIV